MTKRPILTVLVDRLGQEKADRVSAAFGGTRLDVPVILQAGSRLANILGDELAILLVIQFGGSRIYVPRPVAGFTRPTVDTRKVKRLLGKGLSARQIARELGCSERTIENKRAKLRQRARQTNRETTT